MKPAMKCLADGLRSSGGGGCLTEKAPMAPYTTFRIGGVADLLFETTCREELLGAWRLAHTYEVPCLVLGRGSNVLVADQGVRGLVLLNRCADVDLSDTGTLRAASGTALAVLAKESSAAGWAGLEWAIGIPGSVGGAVISNAGAHGGYVGDVLQSVTVLDHGELRSLSAVEAGMGYRTSSFKAIPCNNGRPLILEATFGLRPAEGQALEQQMAEWLQWRQERQPQEPSAGSVFKRTAQYPAGFLIDQAGLKGKRRGEAMVSEKHANFVVNLGRASSDDVRGLIEEVQETVLARFGERLELEIELIGDWGGA